MMSRPKQMFLILSLQVCLFIGTGLSTSGSGFVTHSWDCCKPSCAWPGHDTVIRPVQICDINDHILYDPNAVPGCTDPNQGNAYMCSAQTPWATDGYFSFGFAAVNLVGQTDRDYCCACYSLTFTSAGPLKNKKMIVQATNTGYHLADNQFDLATPGGGGGVFSGCSKQWQVVPLAGYHEDSDTLREYDALPDVFKQGYWGEGVGIFKGCLKEQNGAPLDDRYGGFTSRSQCDALPDAFKQGCYWRFDWYGNAGVNSTVDFQEVTCPQQLIDRSQCWRT